MHVLFCHGTYYSRAADGEIYAHGAFPYALWVRRVFPHFEKLTVIGRDKPFDPRLVKSLDVSSGDPVDHLLMSNINAPLKRLLAGGETFRRIKDQVANADAVIIRGPAEFGMMAAKAARTYGKPCAVEMSGCGFDNVWMHGSAMGKFYAPLKYIYTRNMVKCADQVIYVTEQFLQNRYPAQGLSVARILSS